MAFKDRIFGLVKHEAEETTTRLTAYQVCNSGMCCKSSLFSCMAPYERLAPMQ